MCIRDRVYYTRLAVLCRLFTAAAQQRDFWIMTYWEAYFAKSTARCTNGATDDDYNESGQDDTRLTVEQIRRLTAASGNWCVCRSGYSEADATERPYRTDNGHDMRPYTSRSCFERKLFLGPFYGAIAVPSVTRWIWDKYSLFTDGPYWCAGGVRHLVNRREAARSGEWAQHFSDASCLFKDVGWSLTALSRENGDIAAYTD